MASNVPRWGAGNSEPNSALHLVVTVCTCGLWLPVWLTVDLLGRRRAKVGPESGIRGFMSAHPTLSGIAPLACPVLILVDWKAFLLLASLVATLAGVIILAVLATRAGQRRRQEKAEIAARADDQNEALLRGDDQWGLFGIKSAAEPLGEPLPKPRTSARQSLIAGAAVVAGLFVFAVMATVNARSADQATRAVPPPTVTVTRPASRPIPHQMNPTPALDIPFPFIPAAPFPAPTLEPAQPSVPPVRMGQQTVDGDATFAVTSVNRSKTVGNPNVPFLQTIAEGTFITVQLTITNNGNQPEVFVMSYQRLRINRVVYAVDPTAALWTLTLETIIGPGGTATVPLSFDVPTDTPLGGMLELHGSSKSRGANIELLPQ